MTAPELQSLAQLFTGRLLNTGAAGIVLACLVWLLLRLMRRQNSGTRFAIWFGALLAIVALPFVAGAGQAVIHSPDFAPANQPGIMLSGSWAVYLFAAWAVGAVLFLLRLCVGLWGVRRIHHTCSELELASLDPAIAALVLDFEPDRKVKLCVSDDVAVPLAIGFFRPAIVFPAWLWPRLSAGEIKVILLHELAHLQRRDDWTNLAQKIVQAVFFFHPAVWWIENRLTLEREMACDDMVLAQTASPRNYASSLISFAEKLQAARGPALAQALVTRMRHMSLRLAQILDAKRPRRIGVWRPVLGLSAALFAMVIGTVPYAPRLVAFQSQPKQSQTQHMQVTSQATNGIQPQRLSASDHLNHATAAPIASSASPTLHARAIAADFQERTSALSSLSSPIKVTSPSKALIARTTAAPKEPQVRETFVMLQSTQYDASGTGVWTLTIWTVRGAGNSTERRLESTIIVSSI